MPNRTVTRGACLLVSAILAGLVFVAPAARADVPYPGAAPGDWGALHIGPGGLPDDWDADDYKLTSERAGVPWLRHSPHHHWGVKGASVDRAWEVTTGRPDVLIAVLDSGIRWRDRESMRELRNVTHLNVGELPLPEGAATHDMDGNGIVTVDDWAGDRQAGDRNANGLLDPEDLILAFSDGTDGDGNGYVDDIAGWDFVDGDNDPLDDVDYGHGTGEARDSTAEADNAAGGVGTCPNCRSIPVRVGDSFITDGGRFAAGVLFALDSGADVVQEALGVVNNPPQVQQAIDAAWKRSVPVMASMADEASKHPNLPAALERTITLNSVTRNNSDLQLFEDYMALNGCTNYGAHAYVSVPSDGCSSEATGLGSGMMGLAQSVARNAVEAGTLEPHPDTAGLGPGANVLSAGEAKQLFRLAADDIDFATPIGGDPANHFGFFGLEALVRTTSRYETGPGWDQVHGYGRINADRLVRMIEEGRIPPEVDIRYPRWSSVLPAKGTVEVRGRVSAPRAGEFTWRVEWTPGVTPPRWPGADVWHPAGEGSGSGSFDGILGSLDLTEIAAALPDGGAGPPLTSAGLPDPDRFAVRVRVVVDDDTGLTGEHQKQIFVHGGDRLALGTPRRLSDSGGAGSPAFHDLDGAAGGELVLATDAGRIHAWSARGSELPGWPVASSVVPWWPSWSRTAGEDRIAPLRAAFGLGAPVVADLGGDGDTEIGAADISGHVWVWNSDGSPEPGFPVSADPAYSAREARDEFNRLGKGFFGNPAAGDLDGDGDLEIVVAGLDRHVYAWHHDGVPVPGFPVLLIDPAKVEHVDADTHKVTFRPDAEQGIGGALTAVPSVGDLTGDGRAEIVVGAQEQYAELSNWFLPLGQGNARVYAIHPDGSAHPHDEDRVPAHPHEQAYLPGWPAKVGMVLLDLFPVIGDGVPTQSALGDVDGDGRSEVVVAGALGPLHVLNEDGSSAYGETLGLDVVAGWSGAALGPGRNSRDEPVLSAFGGPTIGRLDADGVPDFAMSTAGLGTGLDLLLPNLQSPSDTQVMGWSGRSGKGLAGLPRVTSDVAFFSSPAIADVDDDGDNDVVVGNGVNMLDAYDAAGHPAKGFPKVTGGWVVGTPAVGDWDGDGRAEVAVVRRDGLLLVWRTDGDACAAEWGRFGHDGSNAGDATNVTDCAR